MRKRDSYVRKYGEEVGGKLYRLLQQEANMASQVAKFKKKYGLTPDAGFFPWAKMLEESIN